MRSTGGRCDLPPSLLYGTFWRKAINQTHQTEVAFPHSTLGNFPIFQRELAITAATSRRQGTERHANQLFCTHFGLAWAYTRQVPALSA
jgi:hypothetical protein